MATAEQRDETPSIKIDYEQSSENSNDVYGGGDGPPPKGGRADEVKKLATFE